MATRAWSCGERCCGERSQALYAEVISVERGDLAAVRAEGRGVVPAAAISAALEQLAPESLVVAHSSR
ncbi:MAG: hypothetical protein ACR2HX_03065 [Pyrinomonadaceae bacterium]